MKKKIQYNINFVKCQQELVIEYKNFKKFKKLKIVI